MAMEMSRSREGLSVPSREERVNWARNTIRALAHRRAERRAHQLALGLRERGRTFGRGAVVGYAIQENPGRAALVSFSLGLVVGAIAFAIRQVSQDYQDILLDEEREEPEIQSRVA